MEESARMDIQTDWTLSYIPRLGGAGNNNGRAWSIMVNCHITFFNVYIGEGAVKPNPFCFANKKYFSEGWIHQIIKTL